MDDYQRANFLADSRLKINESTHSIYPSVMKPSYLLGLTLPLAIVCVTTGCSQNRSMTKANEKSNQLRYGPAHRIRYQQAGRQIHAYVGQRRHRYQQ